MVCRVVLKGKSLSALVLSIWFAYQYLDVLGKMLWQGGRKSEFFVWAGRAASSLWSGWRIGQVGRDSQQGKCRFGQRSEFWQQFNTSLFVRQNSNLWEWLAWQETGSAVGVCWKHSWHHGEPSVQLPFCSPWTPANNCAVKKKTNLEG